MADLDPHPVHSTTEFVDSDSPNEISTEATHSTPCDVDLARWESLGQRIRAAFQNPVQHESPDQLNRIGDFQVVRILGRGGNGSVYLARDLQLHREVAIKIPHRDALTSEHMRARFLQEAKLVAGLRHPHIVEIYQVGETSEFPYLVFEYCQSGSLAEWLQQQQALPNPRTCAAIIRTLAMAAHEAHRCGILHRDLNPRNVLLVPEPANFDLSTGPEFPFVAKLSDFGLGTWLNEQKSEVQTQTGMMVGTIPYMAPEQTVGDRFLQPTVDVYALGVMLYELLARKRPFQGTSPVETLRLVRETEPMRIRKMRPQVSRDLETICHKCLEKTSTARYHSALELFEDLDRYLHDRPIRARRTTIFKRSLKWIQRHRWLTALGTLVCLLSLVLWGGSMWHLAQLDNARQTERKLSIESDERYRLARRLAYAGQMRHAQEMMQSNQPYEASQILRKWIPQPEETDYRCFDWYCLMQNCGGEAIPIVNKQSSMGIANIAPGVDEKHLLIGCTDMTLEEWGIEPATLHAKFSPVPHFLRDFRITRPQQLVYVYRDSPWLGIRNLSDQNELHRIVLSQSPEIRCLRLALTPDHGRVLSILGRTEPTQEAAIEIQMREIKSGKLAWRRQIDRGYPFQPAFDNSTETTMIAQADRLLALDREGVTAYEIPIPKDTSRPRAIAISGDSKYLAILTETLDLLLWQRSVSGKWEFKLPLPIEHRASKGTGDSEYWHHTKTILTFSGDNRKLWAATKTELHVWDLETRLEEQCLRCPFEILAIEALNDGKSIAWSSNFEAGVWRPIPKLPQIPGHLKETWAVAFSPDGRILATGSDDETVRLWEVGSNKLIGELTGHRATVTQVAFSPDGKRLAAGTLDQSFRIWNVESLQLVTEIKELHGDVRALAWSADNRFLLSGESGRDYRCDVRLWDAKLGRPIQTVYQAKEKVRSVLFASQIRKIIACSEDKTVAIMDQDNGRLDGLLQDPLEIHSAVLLNHDRWLATGNESGLIRIWDLETHEIVRELRGPIVDVRCLAISPDEKVLASGGHDGTIRLWDPTTGETLLVLMGQTAAINSIAFSPNGETLASGAHDGGVKLWHGPRFESAPASTYVSLNRPQRVIIQPVAVADPLEGKDWIDGPDRAAALDSQNNLLIAAVTRRRGRSEFLISRLTPNGDLDRTFRGGIINDPIAAGAHQSIPYTIRVQPDDRILVAGIIEFAMQSVFAVIRYHPSGERDFSFGNAGVVTTHFDCNLNRAYGMALQNDAKIVVAGSCGDTLKANPAIVRFNPDGSIDTTFGQGGKLVLQLHNGSSDGEHVAVQADGKIVIAGWMHSEGQNQVWVFRLHSNGTLDQSFGSGGQVITRVDDATYFMAFRITPEGKLVAGGAIYSKSRKQSDFLVVRYLPDGSLDASFDKDGIRTFRVGQRDDYCRSVLLQPDGKIICGGGSSVINGISFSACRTNLAGELDPSFGNEGHILASFPPEATSASGGSSLVPLADGGFYFVGTTGLNSKSDLAVARYNRDGQLDATYGKGGFSIIDGAVQRMAEIEK